MIYKNYYWFFEKAISKAVCNKIIKHGEAKQLNIDDYSASIYTSGTVLIDGSTSAGLDFAGDRDWFKISLIQGYTYQFDCTESGSIDPYLYLRDSQGNIITYDDDGGSDGDRGRPS